MKQIVSNPLENATSVPIKLTDSRWLAEEGWTKMQRIITTSNGEKIIVHFNYNTITKLFDDFKFVN